MSRCSAATTVAHQPDREADHRSAGPAAALNTRYGTVCDGCVAAEMHRVIVGHAADAARHGPVVRPAKRERRRLGITTGNAQELYFPVCFELAVRHGPPAEGRGGSRTAAARHPLRPRPHRDRGAQPPSPTTRRRCALESSSLAAGATWRRRGDHRTVPRRPDDGAGPSRRTNATVARQRVWSALVADATPNLGAAAHRTAAMPWSIVELGLSP